MSSFSSLIIGFEDHFRTAWLSNIFKDAENVNRFLY